MEINNVTESYRFDLRILIRDDMDVEGNRLGGEDASCNVFGTLIILFQYKLTLTVYF